MGKEITPPAPERMAEIEAVVIRARAGDPAAVPRLRELFDEFSELSDHFGDIASHAVAAWVRLAAGPDLCLAEGLARKAEALKRELVAGSDDPILALVADRVVMTWLEVGHAVMIEAQALQGRENLMLLKYRAKRRQQAERSHQTALAMLATLQKLLPPARPAQATPALPPPAPAIPEVRNRLAGLFASSFPLTTVN